MSSCSRSSALALVVMMTASSCSLLSTDALQEGSAAGATSASTSGVTAGPGTVASSSAGGATTGDGGGGTGGSTGGGGPSTDAATAATSSTGGGGSGGDGPVGPCGESSTYADIVLGDGPVAYFRMGADAESLGVDWASNPHDATRQGALDSVVSPLGQLGGCAMHANTLKGAPAMLSWTPPDPAIFGTAGVYSLEMWFVVDELPPDGDARFLFAREYADGNRFHLYVSGGGALYWFFDYGSWRQIGFDDANIVPGALHHAVAIRAGAPGAVEDDIYFFYDGRIKTGASGGGDGELDDTETAPLTMPGLAYSDPADGTFDEIAIYDRVLSQDEVRSHYCAIIHDAAICP